MTNNQKKFASVKETAQLYPFSESSLRYLIFHSKTNGLDTCLRRIGKKILFNLQEFEMWLDNHKEVAR